MDAAEIAALGISRGDLIDVAMMPAEQVQRMRTMGALHGVDVSRDLSPRAQAEVALTCAHCRDAARCHRDLSAHVTDRDALAYCPNAAKYESLAQD